jgi:hypothetical protein
MKFLKRQLSVEYNIRTCQLNENLVWLFDVMVIPDKPFSARQVKCNTEIDQKHTYTSCIKNYL